MREFDKTLRLVMPFVLLLVVIFIFAMKLSGPTATTLSFPNIGNGTTTKPGNWFEPGWAEQVKTVRSGQTDRIEVSQELVGDEHLLQLKDLNGLRELIIDRGQISDNGLAPLTTLRNLEHLRIRCRVRDVGFRQLCAISSLQILNLPQADVADASLESLRQLHQLRVLRIASPRVTDAGMNLIAQLNTLTALHLIDIPITDKGLKVLETMRNLQSLYLDGARISEPAYEQLFRTSPHLHVHINQLHHDRDPHKADHQH